MRGVREKTPGALRARGFSLTGPRTLLLRHTFLAFDEATPSARYTFLNFFQNHGNFEKEQKI